VLATIMDAGPDHHISRSFCHMTESSLTHRERLLRTLRRQPVDRVPDYEFRAWVQTIDRWANEGMPIPSLVGIGHPTTYLEYYLRQGWNRVLCKIGQAEGEWGFHLRVLDEYGRPWPDLQVKA
jgi:hypothetical protein